MTPTDPTPLSSEELAWEQAFEEVGRWPGVHTAHELGDLAFALLTDLRANLRAARLIERGWTRALPESADEGLEALRTLSDAATPGPWDTYGPNDDGVVGVYQRGKRPAISYMDWHHERSRRDAELTAAAVNYVRAALAATLPEPGGGS